MDCHEVLVRVTEARFRRRAADVVDVNGGDGVWCRFIASRSLHVIDDAQSASNPI